MSVDTVVIIEDEGHMRDMLSFLLGQHKYDVEPYTSAEDFLNNQKHHDHCIYLVDSRLPGIQGPDVIRAIRSRDKISPIFIVSAAKEEEEISKGLKAGADDYVLKPFHPEHLLTKVNNARQKAETIFENFISSGIKYIPESCTVINDGRVVTLTRKEFRLIKILHSVDGVVTREVLLEAMDDHDTSKRNIDTHIFALRKKLKDVNMEIETIRNQGYRLKIR